MPEDLILLSRPYSPSGARYPTPVISPFPYPGEFEALQSPSALAMQAAAFETYKTMLPYVKYIDPSERQRFAELSQQEQTRELLLQNLEAMVELGGARIITGIGRGIKRVGGPVPKTCLELWDWERLVKLLPEILKRRWNLCSRCETVCTKG